MIPTQHTIAMAVPEVAEEHRFTYWYWGNPAMTDLPALLCVHGLTRNGRDFDFLAREMADQYQVLCPDMPGRGKSDWLASPQNYNYDTYLADVIALLDSRKIKQVDWLGTSMGGILGMRVAAERPALIHKLVLNDIGAVIPLAGLKRINDYVGFNTMFSDRAEAETYLKQIHASFGITQEEHWQHLTEYSFTQLSNGEFQLAYDPGILDPLRDPAKKLTLEADTQLWPWWDAVQCPVLVIRGENSDILLPETVDEMVVRRPNTAVLTIPQVGHAPSLMEPNHIQFIKDWLISN